MDLDSGTRGIPVGKAHFGTTCWSLVLSAAHSDWDRASGPLSSLCCRYWAPVYTYIRRCGRSAEDSQDLTQEFFLRLLHKNYLKAADPEKGKFRSFLLTILKRFMANERDYRSRQKRGGDRQHLSLENEFLDFAKIEHTCGFGTEDSVSPAEAFERRWAIALLEQVLTSLESEFLIRREAELFAVLKPFLTGEEDRGAYRNASQKLAMTQGAMRIIVYRMRLRYRELLRYEIAQTVSRPEEIEEELLYLFSAINR